MRNLDIKTCKKEEQQILLSEKHYSSMRLLIYNYFYNHSRISESFNYIINIILCYLSLSFFRKKKNFLIILNSHQFVFLLFFSDDFWLWFYFFVHFCFLTSWITHTPRTRNLHWKLDNNNARGRYKKERIS